MKKVLITILAALIAFGGTVASANSTIRISGVSVNDGLVTVKIENLLSSETNVTVTAIKEDVVSDNIDDSEDDRTYAFGQITVDASATADIKFVIPDEKKGIRGSGSYIITAQNGENDRAEYELIYADNNSVEQFVQDLKSAATGVLNSESAYLSLVPVVTNPDNKAVVISMGIDYDAFMGYSEDIRNEALNVFYVSGINDITSANISQEFRNSLGVSVYNNKSKTEGLTIIAPEYNCDAARVSLYGEATERMESNYTTYAKLKEDFKTAYGLVTIKKATVDTVMDTLVVFTDETGHCREEINKIKGLTSTKSYTVCKYIVEQFYAKGLDDVNDLKEILKAAYNAANPGGTGSSGGGLGIGGGGGATGSSANKVVSNNGAVSVTQGSGGTDKKEEVTMLFSDMPVDHWAAESVEWLKSRGIVNGTDTGAFEPDRAITREEFAKMIVLICGFDTVGADTAFVDAEPYGWYRKYIGVAADKGIVSGIGDNMFGIGKLITRQDMAVMTQRALTAMEISLPVVRDYASFADSDKISDYAREAVISLYVEGVISGKSDGLFAPEENATRAEAAKIIYEAFN